MNMIVIHGLHVTEEKLGVDIETIDVDDDVHVPLSLIEVIEEPLLVVLGKTMSDKGCKDRCHFLTIRYRNLCH